MVFKGEALKLHFLKAIYEPEHQYKRNEAHLEPSIMQSYSIRLQK